MYLLIVFFCLFTIRIFSKKFLDVGNYHPIITRKIIMKILSTILKPIFIFEIIINPIFFSEIIINPNFFFEIIINSFSPKNVTSLQRSKNLNIEKQPISKNVSTPLNPENSQHHLPPENVTTP